MSSTMFDSACMCPANPLEEYEQDLKDTMNIIKNKTFKQKYREDAEFKQKHLNYVNEKMKCSCGRSISRSNYSKHLKTDLHDRRSVNVKVAVPREMVEQLTPDEIRTIVRDTARSYIQEQFLKELQK